MRATAQRPGTPARLACLCLSACAGAAPRVAEVEPGPAPETRCEATDWTFETTDFARFESSTEERRTMVGDDGALTDHCLPDGNLGHAVCERERRPPEHAHVHDHSPGPWRLTGRVVEERVECDGQCVNGTCLSRCPSGELVYVAIAANGDATFASVDDPRRFVCTFHSSWALGEHDCVTTPQPGDSVIVTGTGMYSTRCTGGTWGNIAVGAPSTTVSRCSYRDCHFVYGDASPVPPERPAPVVPPPAPIIHAAWRPEAMSSAALGRHVVDLAGGRLFVADALVAGPPVEEDAVLGIAAVDVASGAILWRTEEAMFPMALEGGALVAGGLGVLDLLSPSTGVQLGACTAPVPMITDGPRGGSGASVYREAGAAFLAVSTWTRYFGGMAPPRGTPLGTSQRSVFPLTVTGATCALGERIEPTAAVPREPELEIRRRVEGSDWVLSFARVGEPDEVVLGRGPALAVSAGPSPDGARLFFTIEDAGTTRLTVFDLSGLADLGEVALPHGIRAYAIAGDAVVWSSATHVGAHAVATGVELWRHELRARIHRVPMHPP